MARPDDRQRDLIRRWADLDKIRLVPKDLPFAVDAYDDCIADLDEQLGMLSTSWPSADFSSEPGSSSLRTTGKASASTAASSAMARVSIKPSCTCHLSSSPLVESRPVSW